PQGTTEYSGSVDLVAGRNYQIKLEYFEQGGPGHLELLWKKPGSDVASHVDQNHRKRDQQPQATVFFQLFAHL
ncbi:MAG: hypothetical protein CMG81_06780, partial [Marinobacter sp.]|nr:hypothetical protein [Marinobacter sp.]